jgi:hypothetical protein
MRRVILLSVALALGQTYAYADVYVKVDAQGNAIGGAIVCDAAICGAGSEYSRLTLQPGEQYVLQGHGHSGIGNNNPDTQVKVDIPTQTWTVTTSTSTQVFTPDTPPPAVTPTPTPAPSIIDTSTATTDTATATVETATATITTNILDQEPNETWDWEKIIAWVTAWFEKWWRL